MSRKKASAVKLFLAGHPTPRNKSPTPEQTRARTRSSQDIALCLATMPHPHRGEGPYPHVDSRAEVDQAASELPWQALFQRPLSEPDLHTFHASGSPVDRVGLVSAPGMTPGFTATSPVRLAPFAVWTAFPAADYDGASVALGVAPVRRSRVPCVADETGCSRCPVRALAVATGDPFPRVCPGCRSFSSGEEARLSTTVAGLGARPVAHRGSGRLTFTLATGSRPTWSPTWLQCCRPFRTGYFPLQLSPSGGFGDLEVSHSISPRCCRDQTTP
jgi:hypothetical protein